jgi:hypothetical protein
MAPSGRCADDGCAGRCRAGQPWHLYPRQRRSLSQQRTN